MTGAGGRNAPEQGRRRGREACIHLSGQTTAASGISCVTSKERTARMTLTSLRESRDRLARWTLVFVAASYLLAPVPVGAQAGVVIGVFGTPFEDGLLHSDWGAKGTVSASSGTGGEFRWAKGGDDQMLSVGLLQTVPAVRGAKTLQPFASIGVFRAKNEGEHGFGLSVAGGMAAFIGHLGFDADFRYLLGFERFADEKIRDRQVSFGLLWRF